MIGVIRIETNDLPANKGRIKKSNRNIPYLFKKPSMSRARPGETSPINIFPPSNGWIGTRLKTARLTFRTIKGTRSGEAVSLKSNEKTLARRIFEIGPATEMRAASLRGFSRLYGSNCTGFPQPKLATMSMSVPMGSRWASGFRVSLPCSLGVGSPSLSAIKA